MQVNYGVTILDKQSYLHARLSGAHTAENVLRFLEAAHEAGVRSHRPSLLLEVGSEGPNLDPASTYRVVSQRSFLGTRFRKIAYVDTSNRNPGGMKFAETVAVNRGANVRYFRDLGEAQAWITGTAADAAGNR